MAHFAQLDENNVVTQVIVVHNNDCQLDGEENETSRQHQIGKIQVCTKKVKTGDRKNQSNPPEKGKNRNGQIRRKEIVGTKNRST